MCLWRDRFSRAPVLLFPQPLGIENDGMSGRMNGRQWNPRPSNAAQAATLALTKHLLLSGGKERTRRAVSGGETSSHGQGEGEG